MSHHRDCCCERVTTCSVTLSGDLLVLEIPTTQLYNGMTREVCIAQTVPEIDPASPPIVAINSGETVNTVLQTNTKGLCGVPNYLYADQLALKCDRQVKSRQRIRLRYGEDTACWHYIAPCSTLRKSMACTSTSSTTAGRQRKLEVSV